MKKYYLLLIAVVSLMCISRKSFATHAAALDLSYTCYGNNVYQFVATFYRDCNGIDAPPNLPFDLFSASCNFLDTTSYTMQLAYTTQGTDSISHLAGLCPDESSQCIGGNYQGYEQYIYVITLTMPLMCDDWVIDTHLSSRNNAITNLNDPGNQDLFVECHFSNANGLCESSPQFTTIPLAYSCVHELFIYNHGAYDPDGDSLVYHLANPLHKHNVPISYSSIALSPTYPIYTVDGTFGFDSLTGQMSCIPNSIQIVVISVLIDQYRNGVNIGSVQRDLQIIVKQCSNSVPTIPDGIQNVTGGFLVDSNTVQVCPGGLLNFDLIGMDIDVDDDLTMTTNLPITIPDATYSVTGNNPDTLHFQWQTTPGDTGFYVFTVTIKDDGCPISGQSVYSFTVQVGAPDVDAGPDLLACVTNPIVQLHVDGLSPYLWSNAQYLNNPNSSDPVATLPGLGIYQFIVTADVGGLCENYDTVLVTVTDDFSLLAFVVPDTTCSGDEVSLNATPNGGTGIFTYDWSSFPTGFSSDQASAIDSPASSIQYIVTVSSGGCTHIDTVSVFVRQLPPSDFIIDPILCVGEVTDASVGQVIGSSSYDWNFGNAIVQSGNNPGPYQVFWEDAGTWPVILKVTDQFGCFSSTVIDVEVNPNPVASFDPNAHGCQPLIADIQNTSTGATTYFWEFSDGTTGTDTVSTHFFSPAGTYTITLTATSDKGCTDTAKETVMSFCEELFFPGAFSPNDDGHNDFFHEVGDLGLTSLHYVVYDRWGELVYETFDMNASGWDGKYKGEKCNLGVFVWYAEANFISGNHAEFKGNVTLVR